MFAPNPNCVATLVPAFQLSMRAAVAAGLAIAVANFLLLQHPLYAMISAVIVTDLIAAQAPKLAIPRLMGTVVGSVVGAVLSAVLPSNVWVTGFGVFTAMGISHVLCLQEAAKVAGYVCGIVLLEHTNAPWLYAFFRMCETAIGITIAVGVSFVPKFLRHGGRAG